jgi:hypothetical protein
MSEEINAALNLLRRLPPSKVNQNTQALCILAPHLEQDLLQKVD